MGLALLLDAVVELGVSDWGDAEGAAGAGQVGPGAQVIGGLEDSDAGPVQDRAGGWAGDDERRWDAGLGIGHGEGASSGDAGGFELGSAADGTVDAGGLTDSAEEEAIDSGRAAKGQIQDSRTIDLDVSEKAEEG